MESFGASQSSGVRQTSGRTRSHHQWFGPPSPRIFGAIRSGRKREWPELRQVASPRPRKSWAPQSCLLLPRAHTSRARSCSSTEPDPEREKARMARTPAGRIAEAEEVVGAAILLASPAGAYISGQVLLVDGARSVT